MRSHGAPSSLGIGAIAADTSSGYRNMFGDAPADERYTGFGTDKQSRGRNRRMLRWLATRFGRPYRWPDGDGENQHIPAGYTYLAQFVIHDVVQSLGDLPDLDNGTAWPRNDRTNRLMLDTIYGKAPAADPLFYATSPALPQSKGLLRLGGRVANAGARRDLPRRRCPFAENPASSDVLIADARNDDNLIIAQLTVIFHLLHNTVYTRLAEAYRRSSDTRIFALARKIVTRIYRQIVIEDLLEKLLLPPIYRAYMERREKAIVDRGDARMPLEFSHGAARFGHFMARDHYRINDQLAGEEQSLKSMLRHTSAGRPWAMPLTEKWLIDWATLFDKDGSENGPPLRARRFGPAIAPALVSNDFFPDEDDPTWEQGEMGGLAYRDLLRSTESNLRSVASLLEHIPREILQLSPMVGNGAELTDKWLRDGLHAAPTPEEEEYMTCLRRDMPLLLFVLLEAVATEWPACKVRHGECLGAIGSFIIGDFIFKEYWRTGPLIEADRDAERLSVSIFDGERLNSMPRLIAALSRVREAAPVSPKFW